VTVSLPSSLRRRFQKLNSKRKTCFTRLPQKITSHLRIRPKEILKPLWTCRAAKTNLKSTYPANKQKESFLMKWAKSVEVSYFNQPRSSNIGHDPKYQYSFTEAKLNSWVKSKNHSPHALKSSKCKHFPWKVNPKYWIKASFLIVSR